MSTQQRVEAAIVVTLLVGITLLSGGSFTDCTATLAVFLGFLHVQQSFVIAQKVDALSSKTSGQYFVIKTLHLSKEAVWVTTFACLECYPLLAGALLFAAYPFWREGLSYFLERS